MTDPTRMHAIGPETVATVDGVLDYARRRTLWEDIPLDKSLELRELRRLAGETITPAGKATTIATKGRHDPCVGIRGAPVVEAMMALVLADQALLHRAQCG